MNEQDIKHLDDLIRHIELVKQNCHLLAKRLIERNENKLALKLIARSYLHDNSKFYGIEWEELRSGSDIKSDQFRLAINQHVSTNSHHPEYWPEVIQMDSVSVCEMVCDWAARSSEQGTDLRSFIKHALERYNIPPTGRISKMIKTYVDILLEKPFKKIKIQKEN